MLYLKECLLRSSEIHACLDLSINAVGSLKKTFMSSGIVLESGTIVGAGF